jgi:REP element-mobilizing transposase RayT
MIKERKANRMKGYDYSTDNLYFVTSCVQNRINCFGEIYVQTVRYLNHKMDDLSPKMIVNEYGKIAEQQWYWLADQYPYVKLHAFVVMPNHIHGIIEIKLNAVGTGREHVGSGHDHAGTDREHAGTGHDLSLPEPVIKIKSLSGLIGAYKTTVSKQIHLLGYMEFAWQRSFHDHIIRNEKSYQKIFNYIICNPQKWVEDKFYNNDKK